MHINRTLFEADYNLDAMKAQRDASGGIVFSYKVVEKYLRDAGASKKQSRFIMSRGFGDFHSIDGAGCLSVAQEFIKLSDSFC